MKLNNVLSNNHMNKQINDDASYTIRMRHSIIYLCPSPGFLRTNFPKPLYKPIFASMAEAASQINKPDKFARRPRWSYLFSLHLSTNKEDKAQIPKTVSG